jgi:Fibronectin type III domain
MAETTGWTMKRCNDHRARAGANSLLWLLLAALGGCGGNGSSSGTTPTPTPTPSTAQLTWVAPTLNTDGTPLTDLSGYTISFGLSPTSLSQSVNVTDPSATSYTVTGLSPGTWYFEISAYSSAGTQSAPSNTASKTIG